MVDIFLKISVNFFIICNFLDPMDTNRDVDYGFMIPSIKYGATPIAIF